MPSNQTALCCLKFKAPADGLPWCSKSLALDEDVLDFLVSEVVGRWSASSVGVGGEWVLHVGWLEVS